MNAACMSIVLRLVGFLDTFTVSQVDSFIAIRCVINSEIIRWRQAVSTDSMEDDVTSLRGFVTRQGVPLKYEKYHRLPGSLRT